MKILLMSRYGRLAPSSRVRSYQYLPYLRAHGIQVTVAPLLEDGYVRDLYAGRRPNLIFLAKAYVRRIGALVRSSHFDLVWIEYEMFPWLPTWGEALLSRLGIPYVADYDDAVFHRYDMHPSGLVRKLLGKKIDGVMCGAALVIAGNEYLADRALKAGAGRVEILPTVVDLTRYGKGFRNVGDPFTIGWIGSPTTAPYLRTIRPALAEMVGQGCRLVFVGTGEIALDGLAAEFRAWSETDEVRDIQGFDVGIMPLPDGPWTRGKCGYKLIQYMACNVPVVASPVGVNTDLVEQGVSGFLARDGRDWVNALRTLRDRPGLRDKMGEAGRRKVEREYCLGRAAPRLVSLLKSVL